MAGDPKTASLIFAAGKGSRMKGFEGNKTLLPLIAGRSPFEGSCPILLHILHRLPVGPKALVVNHRKEEVIDVTGDLDLTYCEQPILNGTGGALLASMDFLESQVFDRLIITMGDVPFVKPLTYQDLLEKLENSYMVVLGFRPEYKKQYGVLEIEEGNVKKITEWKYWIKYPEEIQSRLEICNSGIYAFRKAELLRYLAMLEKRPHTVIKERNRKMAEVEEFFITDLVELINKDGANVGYIVAEDECEVMGVDDLPSLQTAQEMFGSLKE